jgi:hypothetical protein
MGANGMSKVRVTNNSEIDMNDVAAVFEVNGDYRVVFNNGTATRYRVKQLTEEAKRGFWELSQMDGFEYRSTRPIPYPEVK